MSVDVTQVTAPVLDTNALIAAAVSPIATQVATQAAQALHSASLQLIDGLTSRVTANEQAIQDAVAKAGGSVLANVENDPATQRALVLSVVGALLLGGLVVLVAALLGNAEAQKYLAGVPAVAAGIILWISKVGVSLPKPVAK